MVEYLLINCFTLVVKLLLPLFIGVGVGALISISLQLLLHVEDRALNFVCRYAGGILGLYLSVASASDVLVQYAKRLWSGVDLYQ